MAKHKVKSQKDNLPVMTIASAVLTIRAERRLTPAMTALVWQIAALLDEQRVQPVVKDRVWLNVSAKRLRGPAAQANNRWLRECLDRLGDVKINGEYRGEPWGAVLLAYWRIIDGGQTVLMMIPPPAVQALRSPETFAKVEVAAVYRLSGPGRRLYASLADKKRLNTARWTYSLDELRANLGVAGKYRRWKDLRRRVLDPAISEINAFGTVQVQTETLKTGRWVTAVTLSWRWKTLDEIRVTAEETEKARPYAEQPAVPTAPPLLAETREDRERNEREWWGRQPSGRRERLEEEVDKQNAAEEAADTAWAEEIAEGAAEPLRTTLIESGKAASRASREAALIRQAYEKAHPDDPPFSDLEPAP